MTDDANGKTRPVDESYLHGAALTQDEAQTLENFLDMLDIIWRESGQPQGSHRDVLRKALARQPYSSEALDHSGSLGAPS